MLPDDQYVKQALLKLDYFVDTDLFLTDTAMLADIVLPVCTSYERGELETYPGCYAWYTKPAIDRVGESKSDTEIIAELASLVWAMRSWKPVMRKTLNSFSVILTLPWRS